MFIIGEVVLLKYFWQNWFINKCILYQQKTVARVDTAITDINVIKLYQQNWKVIWTDKWIGRSIYHWNVWLQLNKKLRINHTMKKEAEDKECQTHLSKRIIWLYYLVSDRELRYWQWPHLLILFTHTHK